MVAKHAIWAMTGIMLGWLLVVVLAVVAEAQADLPPLETAASSFELKAQLAQPVDGAEVCAIDELQPLVYYVCEVVAPPADIGIMQVPLTCCGVTNFRAVTRAGGQVSTPSANKREVTVKPLPPTVLE